MRSGLGADAPMGEPSAKVSDSAKRHTFIGGSDARIIMGDDEAALLRLWREKRGELEPPDYSRNLLVQLGLATEASTDGGTSAQPDRLSTGSRPGSATR